MGSNPRPSAWEANPRVATFHDERPRTQASMVFSPVYEPRRPPRRCVIRSLTRRLCPTYLSSWMGGEGGGAVWRRMKAGFDRAG